MGGITTLAEPRQASDVNREIGTESANPNGRLPVMGRIRFQAAFQNGNCNVTFDTPAYSRLAEQRDSEMGRADFSCGVWC